MGFWRNLFFSGLLGMAIIDYFPMASPFYRQRLRFFSSISPSFFSFSLILISLEKKKKKSIFYNIRILFFCYIFSLYLATYFNFTYMVNYFI